MTSWLVHRKRLRVWSTVRRNMSLS